MYAIEIGGPRLVPGETELCHGRNLDLRHAGGLFRA